MRIPTRAVMDKMKQRGLVVLVLAMFAIPAAADTADPKAAFAAADAGCTAGKPDDCGRLGYAYLKGYGVKADGPKGITILTKACADGSLFGCNVLAVAHKNGEGTKKDPKRHAEISEKVCSATTGEEVQRGSACGRLAKAYDHGTGVKKDVKKSNELYQKACDLGEPFGCSVLGVSYLNGEGGLAKDVERGKKLLDKACKGNIDFACKTLANANKPKPAGGGGGGTCPGTGEIRCGGVCVNTLSPNSRNCGGCGNVCPGGFYCNSGSCAAK